jgi:hypothetical protein
VQILILGSVQIETFSYVAMTVSSVPDIGSLKISHCT